jgi:transposase
MRFVPVKTAEQQAGLMMVGVRDRLIRNRTQLANAIRGHAAEFGLTAARGIAHLVPLLEACCDAWNKLMQMTERIASLTQRPWAESVTG